MGGVTDRYLRYEAAGDQYVGRTVAGLPLMDQDFATLPPFFKERNEILAALINECFPQIQDNMKLVANRQLYMKKLYSVFVYKLDCFFEAYH